METFYDNSFSDSEAAFYNSIVSNLGASLYISFFNDIVGAYHIEICTSVFYYQSF